MGRGMVTNKPFVQSARARASAFPLTRILQSADDERATLRGAIDHETTVVFETEEATMAGMVLSVHAHNRPVIRA
jgi:hypothetical protein